MVKLKTGIAIALGAAIALVGTACGGSDPKQAETPANAPTVSNSTSTAATGGTETGGATEAKGDVAAGKTTFEGTCQACHAAGGTEAGAGPKLQGIGLTAERIAKQVKTPPAGSLMQPNLVTGADLDNVVAYLLSLK